MTVPSPQNAYLISSATGTIHPTVIFDRAPNSSDFNWPITQRWIDASDHNQEYFLLNFLSTGGVVIPNWVILNAGSSGSGVQFLEGDIGGQVPPDVTSTINLLGSGSITTIGDPGTHTIETQLFGLITHNVLVGVDSETIGNVPPSVDSGIPLISQGVASDPTFGTATVPGGGTGSTSFNTNGVVVTGLTSTSPLSAISLSNGQLPIGSTGATPVAAHLTSTGGTIAITNGPGSINLETVTSPSTGFTTIRIRSFTTPGTFTYVPTMNMQFCIAEVCGGGGGGAGPGALGGVAGGGGGTSALGALLSATGGQGGPNASNSNPPGALGGTGAGGDVNLVGGGGNTGILGTPSGGINPGAAGANSYFGGGAPAPGPRPPTPSNGVAGSNGGGGSGGSTSTNNPNLGGYGGASGGYSRRVLSATDVGVSQTVMVGAGGTGGVGTVSTGGAGGNGLVIITEYIS